MNPKKAPTHQRLEPLAILVEEAGRAKEAPPLPKNGIPKQKLPGIIRWPIRALFVPFILLDLLAQKIAVFITRPPYKKGGACKMRGNCCHYVLMEKKSGLLDKFYYWWNTEVNGFYERDESPMESQGQQYHVMSCRYLTKEGLCGHYRLRPRICREWPIISIFGTPRILKGCGFYPVLRGPTGGEDDTPKDGP